jgi:hypothetical protein
MENLNNQIDSYLRSCNSNISQQEYMEEDLEVFNLISSQSDQLAVQAVSPSVQKSASFEPSSQLLPHYQTTNSTAEIVTPRRRKPRNSQGKPQLIPPQLNIGALSISSTVPPITHCAKPVTSAPAVHNPLISISPNQIETLEDNQQQASCSGTRSSLATIIKGPERQVLLEKLKEANLLQFVRAKKLYQLPTGEYYLHFIGHRQIQKFGPVQFGIIQAKSGGSQIKVFLTKLFNELPESQRGKISPPILIHNTPYPDKQYSELRILG